MSCHSRYVLLGIMASLVVEKGRADSTLPILAVALPFHWMEKVEHHDEAIIKLL
jgi:hypothetical protein